MHDLARRLRHDQSGATVVEYGLLLAMISFGIVFGLQGFSNNFVNLWLIVNGYTQNSIASHG